MGFRDHVVGLAGGFAVSGTVRNTPEGVEIDLEGEPAELDRLLTRLERDTPRAARVEDTIVEAAPLVGHQGFNRAPTRRENL